MTTGSAVGVGVGNTDAGSAVSGGIAAGWQAASKIRMTLNTTPGKDDFLRFMTTSFGVWALRRWYCERIRSGF
jgi:hypothetical protein